MSFISQSEVQGSTGGREEQGKYSNSIYTPVIFSIDLSIAAIHPIRLQPWKNLQISDPAEVSTNNHNVKQLPVRKRWVEQIWSNLAISTPWPMKSLYKFAAVFMIAIFTLNIAVLVERGDSEDGEFRALIASNTNGASGGKGRGG